MSSRSNSQSEEDIDGELSFDDDGGFDESDDDSVVDTWQDSEDEDDARVAQDRARTAASSSGSYSFLVVVGAVVVIAMLPAWLQSPNGFPLLKQSLFGGGGSVGDSGTAPSCLAQGEQLFTKSQLAKHTKKPRILLGFLGVVYDVTEGSYYQPDGSYHFFAGKDGTRGFLTGEFTAEELVDDITDLDDSYLNGIDTWLSLYDEKYTRVGLVQGAYYDQAGCATDKLRLVKKKIARAKSAEADDSAEQQKYPPCNSEWNETEKRGRVWCTKLSGGITRDWIGRPRQLYSLKTKSWRCACVREDGEVESDEWCDATGSGSSRTEPKKRSGVKYAEKQDNTSTPNCLFKHYQNCDPQAAECPIAD